MCGIFALMCDADKSIIEKEFMKGKARGPEYSSLDEINLVTSNHHFYMGFHRLAINGLNIASHQPIIFNQISLICNGEIYNYKQLYKMMNINPTTDSDCEVIIHLYLRYGIEETLRMLDGVFAFVIYDITNIQEPKMVVGRDPFGVRPLYKAHSQHNTPFLGFASDMKMLN